MPVALYVAWQIDGEIPDHDAPQPPASTNAAKEQERIENMLHTRRRAHAAKDQDASIADIDDAGNALMDRNYQHHYENILEFCTAIRIWSSQSISREEIERAHDCFARASQSWADMNCHLVPYFHLLLHLKFYLCRLGPVYSWWAYPFERNNGFCKVQSAYDQIQIVARRLACLGRVEGVDATLLLRRAHDSFTHHSMLFHSFPYDIM